MPEEEIPIEHIRVKELYAFASGIIESAQPGEFIPITLHRALAMSKNPYADPEDVALLAAYLGEEVIGYFGIMAVKILHGGELHTAQWFTTWMVSAKHLGRGVGSMLMQAALDLDQDYFIVGSQPARRVCDKFGFQRLPPFEFTIIDFRLAARFNPVTLLLRGFRKLFHLAGGRFNISKINRIASLLFERIFGPLIRPVLYALTLSRAKGGLPAFYSKPVDEVRSPKPERSFDKNLTALHRSDEVVNWMLAYPWALQPGQSQSEQLDFNFSDTRAEFEIFAREIHTDEYRGYVTFQFSVIGETRILKVLDVALKTDSDQGFVLPLALEAAREKHADQIEIPSEFVTALGVGLLGKLILTKKQRICQVHPKSDDSPLGKVWRDLQQNYVDGDTPFT
jgi:GNAT superfamily N-acetyltransferase